MTRRQQVAIATLLCLNFALTGVGYFWLSSQAAAARHAQQQSGQQLETKLCATFARLGELRPPAGDPAANPSRAYLQDQHQALVELGADLGCRR